MKKFIASLLFGFLLVSTPVFASSNGILGPHSQIDPYDSNHNIYSNHDFGFSMVLPKEVAGLNYCNNGKGATMVPLTVFEDGNGSIYIGTPYRYDKDAQGNCIKINNSLAYFSHAEGGVNPDIYWELHAQKGIDNLQELTQFIQKNYGETCSIDTLTSTQQAGTFEVRIKSDGKDLEHSGCPINFHYKFSYNASTHTAVTWILGQAVMFTDMTGAQAYDGDMVDSFHFLSN